MQRLRVDRRRGCLGLRLRTENASGPVKKLTAPLRVIWLGWASNCCARSVGVFSPFTAASATRALKAGLWFRRGHLVMVSLVADITPLSGRNSIYPSRSDCPSRSAHTIGADQKLN